MDGQKYRKPSQGFPAEKNPCSFLVVQKISAELKFSLSFRLGLTDLCLGVQYKEWEQTLFRPRLDSNLIRSAHTFSNPLCFCAAPSLPSTLPNSLSFSVSGPLSFCSPPLAFPLFVLKTVSKAQGLRGE